MFEKYRDIQITDDMIHQIEHEMFHIMEDLTADLDTFVVVREEHAKMRENKK